MKVLFKKAISRSFQETKEVWRSLDHMLSHVPLIIDGEAYTNHGCKATINKDFDGNWEVILLSNKIPAAVRGRKVHVSMKKASPESHLPYAELSVNVESSRNNTHVLRLK